MITCKNRAKQKGIALILVLSALVLITILTLAVLASIGTFVQTTRSSSSNSAARAMADSAITIVTAQIRDATTQDQTKSWASQPGMIRTYDNTGYQSNLYKLYSSPNMVIDGARYAGAALLQEEAPAAEFGGKWASHPAVYTDLNSPELASDGQTQVFPIIDPRAWSGQANVPPIPNSGWNNSTDVQGFSYTDTPLQGAKLDGVNLPTGVNDANARLAMPVQWLYVRKNGYVSAATDNGDGTAAVPDDPNFVDPVANDPSPNPNPIVGRIAFWTDDDTNKIDINTACGDLWSPDQFPGNLQGPKSPPNGSFFHSPGTFWEPPRFATWWDEWCMAQVPVRNEFQRYAGHPSTVYLSAVFPEFSAPAGSAANANTIRNELYSIIPRVNGGTADLTSNTEGGTQVPSSAVSGNANYAATPKHDRLYASTDELLYTMQRNSGTANLPASLFANAAQALEKAKFFITADSQSPELNLFNLPRVSMWPVDSTYSPNPPMSNRCTAYDQLLAYCSSLGPTSGTPQDFFFERNSSLSTTGEYGLGSNPQLYTYLENLLKEPIPGYGGTLGSKYQTGGNGISHGYDQILTEIMDYIRCTNLQDPLLPTSSQFSPADGVHDGAVLPLQLPNGTMGFGRYMTIGEVGLQFIALPPASVGGPQQAVAVILLKGIGTSSVLPLLKLDRMQISISGLQSSASPTPTFTAQYVNSTGSTIVSPITFNPRGNPPSPINGTNFTFPGIPIGNQLYVVDPFYPNTTEKGFAGYGINPNPALPTFPPGTTGVQTPYPWVSDVFNLDPANPAAANTFTLKSNNPLVIKISSNNQTIQTISVDLSRLNGTWVLPTYSKGPPEKNGTVGTITGSNGVTDSVKTMVPGYPELKEGDQHAGGDYRLVAGLENPPSTFWVPEGLSDPSGFTTSVPIAHNLTDAFDENSEYPSYYPGYDYGTIIDVSPTGLGFGGGGHIGLDNVPRAPNSYTGFTGSSTPPTNNPVPFVTELTHDFDQGAGWYSDGALINHPEEVNVNGLTSADRSSLQPPYFSTNTDSTTGIAGQNATSASAAGFASPNRLIPSPGMLGSLPSRLAEGVPWQTLLFRAQPEHPGSGGFGSGGYPGKFLTNPAGTPSVTGTYAGAKILSPPYTNSVMPDHLFLDLFWMPAVEPYAISNTFATAGKINLNYQIMPFTNIDRATAMQAVLRTVRMGAVPSTYYGWAKQQEPEQTMTGLTDAREDFRFDLNLSTTNGGTLAQFENKFAGGDLFRSASQICDVYMVPIPSQWSLANQVFASPDPAWSTTHGWGAGGNSVDADAYNWWNNTYVLIGPGQRQNNLAGQLPVGFKLTGDNVREAPYTDIYSLLTTKSNTYTVHMRVQSLQQTNKPGRNFKTDSWSDPNGTSGGTDVITGEYRGSATIERFLDPSDPNLASSNIAAAAQGDSTVSLSKYYRYRVVSTKQFAP
jgi:Tfp pilus assembly protein PilV